eukprot:6650806-Alexandrium_andersonii.AAC.1
MTLPTMSPDASYDERRGDYRRAHDASYDEEEGGNDDPRRVQPWWLWQWRRRLQWRGGGEEGKGATVVRGSVADGGGWCWQTW